MILKYPKKPTVLNKMDLWMISNNYLLKKWNMKELDKNMKGILSFTFFLMIKIYFYLKIEKCLHELLRRL